MSSGPPLSKLPSFPVIGGTALLAIGLFVALEPTSIDPFMLDVRAFEREPWRLMTGALLHAGTLRSPDVGMGIIHLAFNVALLWRFGTFVEYAFGHLVAASFVVLAAAASGAAEYALTGPAVGLSGVVYGFAGLLWALQKFAPERFAGILPDRLAHLLAFWFVFCIVLTYANVIPVANVAHGVGALCGILAGLAIARPGGKRVAAIAGLVAVMAFCALGPTVLRPTLNFSVRAGDDTFELGLRAWEAGDYERAAYRFEQATSYRRARPEAWFNLGLARGKLGHAEAAEDAMRKAAELAPGDPRFSLAAEGD